MNRPDSISRNTMLELFGNDLSTMNPQARASKARYLALKHGLRQAKDPNDERTLLYSRSQCEGIVKSIKWTTAKAA